MDKTRWPTLTHVYPPNPAKHATTLKADFKAVRRYLFRSGAAAVPKYLFKLLLASYTELSKKILAWLSTDEPFADASLELATVPIKKAMRKAATTSISEHMVAIEEQFKIIQQYLHITKAKGVSKHLLEIIYRSVAGLREELKTQIFTEDPIQRPLGQESPGRPEDTRREQAQETVDDPAEEHRSINPRLVSEELGETPGKQEMREQRRAIIPTQEAMRLAMATIANGSVGELVVPDSDPDPNKNGAIIQPQAQWPPDDDESCEDNEEEESIDEQPRNRNSAKQSATDNRQHEEKTTSGVKEDAISRFTVKEDATSSVGDGNVDSDQSEIFQSCGDSKPADTERFENTSSATLAADRQSQQSEEEYGEEEVDEANVGSAEEDDTGGEEEAHENCKEDERGMDIGEVEYNKVDNDKEDDSGAEENADEVDESGEDESEDAGEDEEDVIGGDETEVKYEETRAIKEAHVECVKVDIADAEEAKFRMAIAHLRNASPLRSPARRGQMALQAQGSSAPMPFHPYPTSNGFVPNVWSSNVAPSHSNEPAQSSGWIKNFENIPVGTLNTYGVVMFDVQTHSLDLSGPKKKIEAARLLAARNAATISNPEAIRYMCWSEPKLTPMSAFRSVVIEFATAE